MHRTEQDTEQHAKGGLYPLGKQLLKRLHILEDFKTKC